jgi:hypothetical protein
MSTWAGEEMAERQRHDARHAKRLTALLTQLSEPPVSSIPSACRGWTEAGAAYRSLDNPPGGVEELLSGPRQATPERLRTQTVAVIVPDTSSLTYGTLEPQAGMGAGQERVRGEYLLQTALAFTPERGDPGVSGAKLWQRPERPVGRERKHKPSEEAEGDRWLEGYALACEARPACPQAVAASVADCEGDIQEWCFDALSRSLQERAEALIRATCTRRLAPGAAHRYLWGKCRRRVHWGSCPSSRRAKRTAPHVGSLSE